LDLEILSFLKQKQLLTYLRTLNMFQRKKTEEGYTPTLVTQLKFLTSPQPKPTPNKTSQLNASELLSTASATCTNSKKISLKISGKRILLATNIKTIFSNDYYVLYYIKLINFDIFLVKLLFFANQPA
jgi:hypothetical protein